VTIRIFQHYWQLPLALLAILEGTIFLAAMHYTAPFTLSGPVPPSQHPAPWVPHSLLFAGIMFVSMAAMGLYNSRQRARLAGLLSRVAASMLGGAMVIAVIVYLLPVLRIGRGALSPSFVSRSISSWTRQSSSAACSCTAPAVAQRASCDCGAARTAAAS
jgi:hypothetical protein